jgi:hypothetical protein
MGSQAGARDLRMLLSVAAKLRHLADDTLCQGDKVLYLMAAQALEKRAEWLAATLPNERESPTEENPRIHQPVDMTV